MRLGEGVAARRALAPAATERALTAVRGYRDRARELGASEVLLVATAAVRQARDGHAFVARLGAEPGIQPRDRQRRRGGAPDVPGRDVGPRRCAGPRPACSTSAAGSTEVLVADGPEVLATMSLDLGVVHLVERFFTRDPVDPSELAACRAYVEARLTREAWPSIRPSARPGSSPPSGTPDDPGRARSRSRGVRPGARAWPPAQRGRRRAADPLARRAAARRPRAIARPEAGRADVIVPGGVVLGAVLAGLCLPDLVVSDAGLREGILLDAVGWRPAPAVAPRATPPGPR